MGPCLKPRPPESDRRPSGLAGDQREARVDERPARQRSLLLRAFMDGEALFCCPGIKVG
ncbi:hypothetical protein BDV40DRAFT_262772 [Aspergillus tamarii]|uniref:Uncharacterized protein n=1 Tax=Aspergillus tamarii TaxID=41984 RepID=A0A5N6V050_ASPTM|nr:hypothetical protein BDV40DRAFT_262772 [Aspergillus tamarii]